LKLLLDTTYLLPAIGISVEKVPSDALIKLMKRGNEIFVSDVSIFELSAKGAKRVAAGALPGERVAKGIRAIAHDETVTIVPIHESRLLLTAFKLRGMLDDFVDCLVLSSAMNLCDALVTEDDDIQSLKGDERFKELLAMTNPRFQIRTMAQALRP